MSQSFFISVSLCACLSVTERVTPIVLGGSPTVSVSLCRSLCASLGWPELLLDLPELLLCVSGPLSGPLCV